ncbi:MAG: hypothetical protein FJ272_02835 [Planctomycetes bacterium]|nr:hypothetical protein [Planctomycetota bacterium]
MRADTANPKDANTVDSRTLPTKPPGRKDRATAPERGLTVRAVALGVVIVALVNIIVAYSEYVIHASRMNLSHFPLILFVAFLLVVIPVNFALKTLRPRWALSPSELLVMLALGLPGAAVPGSGLTGFFLGVIATPFYYASAENQWADYMHQHIPRWLAPRDEAHAMRWFFDGLPEGQAMPWTVWVVPLFWWLIFLAVVVFVTVCISVILRKQWAQHERLGYPLATVATEIVAGADSPQLLPDFMRHRLFWWGFGISFGGLAWNMLHYFWPVLPEIPIRGRWFSFGRDFPTIFNNLNFYTIGFAYFAHPDVLLSIWVFYALFSVQAFTFNRLGFTLGPIEDQWSGYDAANSWLNWGAFVFFVLWGLWVARRHLLDVMRKAFSARHPVDDREEMLSYRVAFFGLLLGLGYILLWLCVIGMELRLAALFVAGTVIIFIGVARIVAESGLIYVRGPVSAQTFGTYLLGSETLSPAAITSLAFTYTIIANGRALFAASFAHVTRLGDFIQANKRKLLAAVCLSLLLGTLVSIAVTLRLGYEYGAANFRDAPFSGLSQSVFRDTVNKMRNPFPTSWGRIALFGVGAAGMAGLTLIRSLVPWWPLHPLGFAISATYLVRRAVFSIFIAWALKTIILRVGGVTLYRKSKPFFFGLLAGYAFGVFASFLVDCIWFWGEGHEIHSW